MTSSSGDGRHLVAALDLVSAKTAPWWLDVEPLSSWAGTYQLKIAALQGFIAGLRNAGATGPIGIYSTSAQWKDITGLTAHNAPTAFHRPHGWQPCSRLWKAVGVVCAVSPVMSFHWALVE